MISNVTHTQYEINLLNNVIDKLRIYMEKNHYTLHGLALAMGLSYLPVYRLFTKKHLPTINSLGVIASYLNCTIAELIDDRVFVDIECFNMIDGKPEKIIPAKKVRVYLDYQSLAPLIHNQFFAIERISEVNVLSTDDNMIGVEINNSYYQIFYTVDRIELDGKFLVEFNSQNVILNVLSVSSRYIVIQDNKDEKKIDIDLIKPIAKFFNYSQRRDFKIFEGKSHESFNANCILPN